MLTGRGLAVVLALLPAVAVCQSPLVPELSDVSAQVQAWNQRDDDTWRYMRRSSSKDDDIVFDETAPYSPPDVLRIVFTPDMERDQEPSVHWTLLNNTPEVHATWWIKLSANWTASPAGGGKMTFLHLAPSKGQVYSNIGGSRPPHAITVNTEWEPYGQRIWTPNKAVTPMRYDRWYRIDWHVSLPNRHRRNALMKWWVDGVLNGEYSAVRVPEGSTGFEQFEFAPTLQNPPPAEQYMFIDHTLISAR